MPAAVLVAAHRYPPRITLVDAVELAEAYEDEDEVDVELEEDDVDWSGWTNRQQCALAITGILAVLALFLASLALWRLTHADDARVKRARAEACGQAPEGDATDVAACINTAG